MPGVTPPGGEGKSTVQFPDPVTGEETANDWKVSFTFKVKLGEMPAAGAAPEPEAAPPPTPGRPRAPAGQPAASGGGRLRPPG